MEEVVSSITEYSFNIGPEDFANDIPDHSDV
jgi:hypothetical protein